MTDALVASDRPLPAATRGITARSILAATGELWLAGSCFYGAWAIATRGMDDEGFGVLALVAYEALGLMVLRVCLCRHRVQHADGDSVTGCLGFLGRVVALAFAGLSLWFHGILCLILLPFLFAIAGPLVGLNALFMLGRRVAWGWANRPKSPAEGERALAYWRLVRKVHWIAGGLAAVVGAVSLQLLGLGHDEDLALAVQVAAAGCYFLALAGFVAVQDPRMITSDEAEAHPALA